MNREKFVGGVDRGQTSSRGALDSGGVTTGASEVKMASKLLVSASDVTLGGRIRKKERGEGDG